MAFGFPAGHALAGDADRAPVGVSTRFLSTAGLSRARSPDARLSLRATWVLQHAAALAHPEIPLSGLPCFVFSTIVRRVVLQQASGTAPSDRCGTGRRIGAPADRPDARMRAVDGHAQRGAAGTARH